MIGSGASDFSAWGGASREGWCSTGGATIRRVVARRAYCGARKKRAERFLPGKYQRLVRILQRKLDFLSAGFRLRLRRTDRCPLGPYIKQQQSAGADRVCNRPDETKTVLLAGADFLPNHMQGSWAIYFSQCWRYLTLNQRGMMMGERDG